MDGSGSGGAKVASARDDVEKVPAPRVPTGELWWLVVFQQPFDASALEGVVWLDVRIRPSSATCSSMMDL